MSCHFLFQIEYSIEDFDLWMLPEEYEKLKYKDLPITFKLTLAPSICMNFTDTEFIDQVNSGKKIIKTSFTSFDTNELNKVICAKIEASKIHDSNFIHVGSYAINNLQCTLKKLAEQFISSQNLSLAKRCSKNSPTCEIRRELAQLSNQEGIPCGAILFSLKFTCFGQSMNNENLKNVIESSSPKEKGDCIETEQKLTDANTYHEYSAESNGNELIIRVRKDDPLKVERVFDVENAIKNFSLGAHGKEIDLSFLKKSEKNSNESISLTDHQVKTSMIGKYENSCKLPAIRGNLKYPGKIEDEFLKIKLSENQLKIFEESNHNPKVSFNFNQQCKDAKLKFDKNNKDVFIFKIGREKNNDSGEKSQLELEMRTPKVLNMQRRRLETREVQVDTFDLQKEKSECKSNESLESNKKKEVINKKTFIDRKSIAKKSFMKKPKESVQSKKGLCKRLANDCNKCN